MPEEDDPKTLNEIVEAISPIVKAHSHSVTTVGHFIFHMLSIASAMAEGIGMNQKQFLEMAKNASAKKKPTQPN